MASLKDKKKRKRVAKAAKGVKRAEPGIKPLNAVEIRCDCGNLSWEPSVVFDRLPVEAREELLRTARRLLHGVTRIAFTAAVLEVSQGVKVIEERTGEFFDELLYQMDLAADQLTESVELIRLTLATLLSRDVSKTALHSPADEPPDTGEPPKTS